MILSLAEAPSSTTAVVSKRHYIGGSYEYSETMAYPLNAKSTIQSDTFLLFYTIYLKPTFSFSFSGGPQHYSYRSLPTPDTAHGHLQ